MNSGKKNRCCGDLSVWQFSAVIVALLISSAASHASPQLDQSFDALQAAEKSKWQWTGAGIGLGIASEAAQTFSVEITGVLTGIDVQIFKGTAVTHKLGVEIRKTRNSIPAEKTADILFRDNLTPDKIPSARPAFVHIDLQDFCLQVNQGEVFAIVLVSQEEQSGYGWQTAVGDIYSGGRRYARSRQSPEWNANIEGLAGHDLGFKTFIDADAKCQTKKKSSD